MLAFIRASWKARSGSDSGPQTDSFYMMRRASRLPTAVKDRGRAELLHIFALVSEARNLEQKARHSMSVRLTIFSAMQQIAEEQKISLPPLEDDLSLHETGFDSLAFAILVARLEDDLGVDPFTIAEDAAFPLTVGDFVRTYENVSA
jgi:acyl carrier protein